MSTPVALLGILVIVAALAALDASTGGWGTVNWAVLGALLVFGLVQLYIARRRKSGR